MSSSHLRSRFQNSPLSSLSGYLRSSNNHPSDHHSSGQAVYLQCQPLYRPPIGPHLAPNRLHQQAPWSSTDHCYRACHPPATPPSSGPGAPRLWVQAGPWRPVAHHTERRNSRPPVSQRLSRWGHLHVSIFTLVCIFSTPRNKQLVSCRDALTQYVLHACGCWCVQYISVHVPK